MDGKKAPAAGEAADAERIRAFCQKARMRHGEDAAEGKRLLARLLKKNPELFSGRAGSLQSDQVSIPIFLRND